MTDHALHSLSPPHEAAPWGLTGLLAMVYRRIQGAFLPVKFREARQIVETACETIGGPLLGAESLDDLDDRLDSVLYSPEFHELTTRLLGFLHSSPESLRRLADLLDWKGPTIGDLFIVRGLPAAGTVLEGDRLEQAVARATIPVLLAEPTRTAEAVEFAKAVTLVDILADPSMPPEVLRCLVGSFRASACLFALGEILQRDGGVEAWLVLALAERRREGLRSYLVMIASCGKFSVPLEVVPASDRFDWNAAHDRTRQGVARLVSLLDEEPLPIPADLE